MKWNSTVANVCTQPTESDIICPYNLLNIHNFEVFKLKVLAL